MANSSTFFFAWVNSYETSFNGSHLREDELIFSFKLLHEEGQFATLELEIINPHIGLLAPGRPFWAWFSWSDGVGVYPLFFGRLIGIPGDLFADVLTVTLVAKPINYTEQRLAIAAGLRVLPFFDPIFIDVKQREDPDVALEGYSRLWHVDRVSHAVSTSDVIAGEDGIEEFAPADVFYDNVKLELAETPLMVCEIDATVSWVQCDHTGVIQFQKQQLAPLSSAVADDMQGMENVNLGNGITIKRAINTSSRTTTGTDNPNSMHVEWNWSNQQQKHRDGDTMSASGHITYQGLPPGFVTKNTVASFLAPAAPNVSSYGLVIGDPYTGQGAEAHVISSWSNTHTVVDKPEETLAQPVATDILVGTEVEQNRTEVIHVRVLADLQPIFTEASEPEDNIKERLSVQASDVVGEGAATASDGVYFPTPRGLQSLEYLMMVARAHLLSRSRVVKTSWDCRFARAVNLSCRKDATIEDTRLPGGLVLGKIVAYQMTGDGDKGEFIGNVTINSAVGYGGALVLAEGTPDYVAVGYVDPGYQHYSGRFVAATTNDMTFSPLATVTSGIQLPISKDQVLIRNEWHDAGQATAAAEVLATALQAARQVGMYQPASSQMNAGSLGVSPPRELLSYLARQTSINSSVTQVIRSTPAWLELEFAPVQNISTDVEYDAQVSPLSIPMQINLSAGSTP